MLASLISGFGLALLSGERDLSTYSFVKYEAEFEKEYASPDERKRRSEIFADNLGKILAHNAKPGKTWFASVNGYTDLTPEEFRAQRTGLNARERRALKRRPAPPIPPLKAGTNLPESVDWRDKVGVVTPVKNQGSCGSCWAFSATETLESAYAIATGKDAPILSPQQLVSCSPNPQHCGGTGGCSGSTQELAFAYTETAGLSLDSAYPYTAVTGTCNAAAIDPIVKNEGYVQLPRNNGTALLQAVATIGPVAISIAASSFAFQSYGGGVYDGEGCGYVEDHAVGLVGYGVDGSKMYWIVRNSWGTTWGMQGYMNLQRFPEGQEPCGVDHNPADGSACEGDDTPVTLCGACGVLADSSYPTGVGPFTVEAA